MNVCFCETHEIDDIVNVSFIAIIVTALTIGTLYHCTSIFPFISSAKCDSRIEIQSAKTYKCCTKRCSYLYFFFCSHLIFALYLRCVFSFCLAVNVHICERFKRNEGILIEQCAWWKLNTAMYKCIIMFYNIGYGS